MQPRTQSPQEEQSRDSPGHPSGPWCPVCSGALIPLRNLYRCARCYYSACAGCDDSAICPPVAD